MAAVEITISGVLYDKYNRTQQNVVIFGEASITGLQVGGGPVIPPGSPPGIWGPTDPRPTPPIPIYPGGTPNPPGIWGPNDPRPTPPIHLGPGGDIGGPPGVGGGPIIPVPPNTPDVPPPGSPPVIVGGTTPTHPITPPPAIIVDYPGVGKVVVPLPTETGEAPGGEQ